MFAKDPHETVATPPCKVAGLPPAVLSSQFTAWQKRSLPPTEMLAAGVWAISLPMPDSGLAFVYCHVIAMPDGFCLIDCGMAVPEAQDRLVQELAGIGYRLEQIRLLLCSHYHRDHYGNAAWIKERTGVTVALHARDIAVLAELAAGNQAEQTLLWEAFGMADLCDIGTIPDEGNPYLVDAAAQPDLVLRHGQIIQLGTREIEVIWTPGHSPGHVCFLDRSAGILFAADQILPRISSGMAVLTSQRLDPLGDYLTSLARLAAVQGVKVVAPGHEYAFIGLALRCEDLCAHHEERMAEIATALCRFPVSNAAALAQHVVWSRPWDQMAGRFGRMAVSETMAHLLHMEQMGGLVRAGHRPVLWAANCDSSILLKRLQSGSVAKGTSQ
jgi:glyoxylase-like metal-dependent hydrolase (beta-lactamase superfamily II)